MTTSTPTIPELVAQRDELNRQIAAQQIPLVNDALTLLTKAAVKTLISDVQAAAEKLAAGGVAAAQLGHVLTVLQNVPQTLTSEIARLEGEAAPPPSSPEA